MTTLRRYEFSERLADILGGSRRDLRFRVTLMVTAGLVPPGPRGPGSPPATPDYAADLLIGAMAAPQQAQTVEAIRCYRALQPTGVGVDALEAGVRLGPPRPAAAPDGEEAAELALLPGNPRFGEALARLLDQARAADTRSALSRVLFGIWLSRGFPVAAVQLVGRSASRRAILTQRYELPAGTRPPAWLDPERGGSADPGLFHSVFLPVSKLIEIAALTSPPERKPNMLGLGQTIANLARNRRNRRPWESFLAKAAEAEAVAERSDARSGRLREVTGFGSNPGNLRMLAYVPEDLPAAAALVVVLHGCTQTATSYDNGTGWSTLADRHGFAVLLPEQRRTNNPLRCFNWFRGEDNVRGSGESLSILQMIEHMAAANGIDRSRVYVTGLSAGGAMTSVMLAAYPEVFAGGAVVAGVPYRCAEGLQDAFDVIFQGRSKPAAEWGDLVRAASPHPGPWPRVSVWHGGGDSTVKPVNAEEIVKQWADVHGLPEVPDLHQAGEAYTRRVWRSGDGQDMIESYTVHGMAHGQAIDPSGQDGCGTPAPFIHDVGISSAFYIARGWGLTKTRREVRPAAPRPAAAKAARPEPIRIRIDEGMAARVPDAVFPEVALPESLLPEDALPEDALPEVALLEDALAEREQPNLEPAAARTELPVIAVDATGRAHAGGEAGSQHASAGSSAGSSSRRGRHRFTTGAPSGVDVQAILSKSFEIAGLAAGAGGKGSPGRGPIAPGGVDIQGILAKSFELAGLVAQPRPAPRETAEDVTPPPVQPRGATAGPAKRPVRDAEIVPDEPAPATPPETAVEPGAPSAATPAADASIGTGAVPAPPPQPETPGLAGSGWEGEGWQLVAGESGEAGGAALVLHGRASSGNDCATGTSVHTLQRSFTLGPRPVLSYVRRLDLHAQVNVLTAASFIVRIDGVPVDEVSAVGMDYAEPAWTEQTSIDLSAFAGRTVTISFEVAASANVCIEVYAQAWLRGVMIRDGALPQNA